MQESTQREIHNNSRLSTFTETIVDNRIYVLSDASFHGDAFREVSRLVHVAPPHQRDVVA